MDISRPDRYRGCLLGLAVGDALGTTVEFEVPGTFAPIDDMVGGGPFALEPGQWTDDTSMALCLARSLVEQGRFDPIDQLERYLRWHRHGYMSSTGRCFDIGNTVRSALERFGQNRHAYCGSTDPATAGNGSIMRLAAVPLAYAHDRNRAILLAAESSRTTHGARAAVDGCRYLAALIVGALDGATREQLFDFSQAPPELCPEIAEIAGGSYLRRDPPQIRGTGYVVKCLEAALWAFARSSDFRGGCLLAANLGEDADTTCAVYGQLAGAYYGQQAIPGQWLDRLAMRQLIQRTADELLSLSRTIALREK
jgi:ADP-ribosylglycohydrolase